MMNKIKKEANPMVVQFYDRYFKEIEKRKSEMSKPTIKIEIDQIKERIIEKLSDSSELCKTIEYEIENQIATYDFTHKVAKEINSQVTTIVSEYFKFGDGYKVLKEAIELSLNTLFKGSEK